MRRGATFMYSLQPHAGSRLWGRLHEHVIMIGVVVPRMRAAAIRRQFREVKSKIQRRPSIAFGAEFDEDEDVRSGVSIGM